MNPPTQKPAGAALWTPGFVMLCLTVSLGYMHYALILPTIPLYIDDEGGTALFAGLVILCFSAPSFLVRPFFGRLADSWSAPGVLSLGLILMMLGGVFYLSGILILLFVAGVLRGLGWAGLNTGGYALLAKAAPDNRRGEASGYYTSATGSVVVLFPAVALWIIDRPSWGYTSVFVLAIAVSGAGGILAHLTLDRLLRGKERTAASGAVSTQPVPATALIDRSVLLPTVLNMSSTLAIPAVTAFLPLYAKDLGVGDVAIFYIIGGVGSALIRPILGSKSDTMGRGWLIGGGLVVQFAGLFAILIANSLVVLLIGGVVAALGNAVITSSTTALAMDLAPAERRGKAMATFSMSFQMGQGFGAIIAGALADVAGLRSMYAGSMAIVGLGLLLLATSWRRVADTAPRAVQQTAG